MANLQNYSKRLSCVQQITKLQIHKLIEHFDRTDETI